MDPHTKYIGCMGGCVSSIELVVVLLCPSFGRACHCLPSPHHSVSAVRVEGGTQITRGGARTHRSPYACVFFPDLF